MFIIDAVIVVLVKKRNSDAAELQKVLTDHGCFIRARLGVHEAGENCSDDGLIILHVSGTKEEVCNLEKAINAIEHVRATKVDLSF